ncbi:MAG TPA: Rieske (2Fe-2S) protein, partial [Terracidiphilus sp.]|nr:Rieske (2Fe-2S) protein [Terracidiphilus sp.]
MLAFPSGLKNLDPRYYVDPGLFERERQAIFRRHWHMLGPVAQLSAPRSYLAVDVAGWKLFALRGLDGRLRGFHNVCRHRGARLLAEGTGHCHTLRCPYHNWVYAEDGSLLNVPFFGEDDAFDPKDWPLQPAQLAEWRGLLFIAIDPQLSLLDQLGDLPDEVESFP